MENVDTICAISTPVGEGGIGIVRMSGPRALPILTSVFLPRRRKGSPKSHLLTLGFIVDPSSDRRVDEVFSVYMKAPLTYTREDVVEIYSHGGLAAQRGILHLLLEHGARLAEPGEFTKRAFLNGRLDLAQAESVLDIIGSETDEELQLAMEHLSGGLSEKILGIRRQVEQLIIDSEALIDFPDEEIDVDTGRFGPLLEGTKNDLTSLIQGYYQGKAVKDGLEALIVGRTNVGKSSLLNALLLSEKAIVTPFPGTTRDLIEDVLHIKGIKLRIVDTAGIRPPRDAVEQEGIERVNRKIPHADLILWVLDGAVPYNDEDRSIHDRIAGKNIIAVLNKSDLGQQLDVGEIDRTGIKHVRISAKYRTGLNALRDLIHEQLMGSAHKGRTVLITSLRHKTALSAALGAVDGALDCWNRRAPMEFFAFELREALHHLGLITGETCTEDLLNELFQRFCIGK